MTMSRVVTGLAAVLSALPAVLAVNRIGSRRPARSSDLPLIAISLELTDEQGQRIGPIMRGDETFDIRYSGTLMIELWGDSPDGLLTLSQNVQTRLGDRTRMQAEGFLRLLPSQLDYLENLLQTPVSGSAFAVWRQLLAYRFVFEAHENVEASEGIIKRIGVDIGEEVNEAFSVP